MAEAKDATNHHVVELEDMAHWKPAVMDQKVPVILDCYADWCAPCRKLTPLLEDAVNQLEGKVKLVKMNVDSFPQLTTGLNVKSLPSVFLIF